MLRKPARHLYTITQCDYKSTEDYLTHFVEKEMNVRDRSDATTNRALMAKQRSATMLKYFVFMGETTTYVELITKIHCYIEVEKTSNLEANKLS